jgi:hypothetical protein
MGFNKSKIRVRLFHNYKNLERLENALKSAVRNRGFAIDRVQNITNLLVEKVEVGEIVWKPDSLVQNNKNLLVQADYEIKQFLEKQSYLATSSGTYETKSSFDPLVCDLIDRKAVINFKVAAISSVQIDSTTAPVKAFLLADQISSLSHNLLDQKQKIYGLGEDKSTNLPLHQARLVYSAVLLSQEIKNIGLDLNDFAPEEFLKLSGGLLSFDSGFPLSISKEQAKALEVQLYRATGSSNNVRPFQVTGFLK